jgi:uncharacterized protein (TIRG00374 family)
LFGIALSGVLLVVLVMRLDWAEFIAAFRHVSAAWLLGAAAMVVATVSVRALRWQIVAGLPLRAWPGVWYADVIGYVGNLLYPGRAGELLRVAALHHIAQVRPGEALASAFADRLGDLLVLAVITGAVFGAVVDLPRSLVVTAVAVATIPLVVFVVFLAFGSAFAQRIEWIAAMLPRTIGARTAHWYHQALERGHALRSPKVLAVAVALSFAAAACDYTIIFLAIRAMGWALPILAAVTVGVLIAFGTLLPAAPGYIGIYQIACVLALRPFGVGESAALAYSVVLQVTILGVFALLGLASFARYGSALLVPRAR